MHDTYDNSDKVINIPIKNIKPNPYKVRRYYDITSVSKLADSIKSIGLLQPILVRRINSDSYELISGERRLRGAEIAGFDTIRAIVMDVSDNQSAVFSLAENVQRKNVSFIDIAIACYHLIFDHELTRKQLSAGVGLSEGDVSKMLQISKLSPTLRKIISENNLSEDYAIALLKASGDAERLSYLNKAIDYGWNAKQLDSYINNICVNADFDTMTISKKVVHSGGNDYRIVFNTLKEAIRLVNNAGIRTRARRYERDRYYEYVIRISK